MISLWDRNLWDTGLWGNDTGSGSWETARDLRQFGAVGDGVTDDTAAVKAALTNAAVRGIRRVSGPAGTYLVSSTIKVPAGVRFDGTGVVIKQADGANLWEVISLGSGAQLVGVEIDGNWANNASNSAVVAVRIGNSNDCIVDHCTVRNCPGYGIVVNHGLRARITNNVIENTFIGCTAVFAADGVATFHRIEGNHATRLGWTFLVTGGSHDIIRNNTVAGHLIGGPGERMTVNLSGTTVSWVSGPDFSEVIKGNWIVFNGGYEFFVTDVVSPTVLTVSTPLPAATGMRAAIGPGDLIGIVGGSYNLVDGNTLVGGATFGMGLSQGGNSVDTAHNTFSHNNISGCGKTAIVVAWNSGTGALRNNSILGNKVKDSGLSPDGSILDQTAIAVAGANVFDTLIDANAVQATYDGDGQMLYWLGTDGSGDLGEIKVGRNLSRGVANASAIHGDVSDISLTGWGSTAVKSDMVSHGHSVRFTITAGGSGRTSNPSFTVSKRVDSPENPPMVSGEVNSASGMMAGIKPITDTQSSTQGNWTGTYQGSALASGDQVTITLKA